MKDNLTATFKEIANYFPDTIVLPTYGNNDSKNHDAAIDEADRDDYYSLIMNIWFNQMPGNVHLYDSVKSIVMNCGYYRVDVSSNVTVLTLNTLYYDIGDTQ